MGIEIPGDAVLPMQFFPPGGAAMQPEKRLMTAVLEDAVRTYHARGRTTRRRRLRREVTAWFASDETDWPFSFANVCDALGLDRVAVRSRIMGAPREHGLTAFRRAS